MRARRTRNVLVTGGAGYIGSHMVKLLAGNNWHVVVVDDLSTGHRDAVRGAHFVEFCTAHLFAREWLGDGGGRQTFNLGSEMSVTALGECARRVLGRQPKRSDFAAFVRDAWRWERRVVLA